MDVPQGHPNDADPRAFLEGVRPQIQAKLEEEIEALNGVVSAGSQGTASEGQPGRQRRVREPGDAPQAGGRSAK